MPALAGKLQGFAVRVPVPTGSLVDLTVEMERETSVDEVNALFEERADHDELAGILRYSEEPLVSSDIIKSPDPSIFDAPLTMVNDGTQVKIVAWYDNEWVFEPASRARPARPDARPGRGVRELVRCPSRLRHGVAPRAGQVAASVEHQPVRDEQLPPSQPRGDRSGSSWSRSARSGSARSTPRIVPYARPRTICTPRSFKQDASNSDVSVSRPG